MVSAVVFCSNAVYCVFIYHIWGVLFTVECTDFQKVSISCLGFFAFIRLPLVTDSQIRARGHFQLFNAKSLLELLGPLGYVKFSRQGFWQPTLLVKGVNI